MGKSYKNFWSLNTDEAIVAGILRDYFKKSAEVFVPLNAQMKDIDLVLVGNNKVVSIQVKGSRAYEPRKGEVNKWGNGSAGWFFVDRSKIVNSLSDYFCFLIYVINEKEDKGRRVIEPHLVTIETSKLREICDNQKILHKRYSFLIWVNPSKKIAFDFRDEGKKGKVDLTKYLDDKGLSKLSVKLK